MGDFIRENKVFKLQFADPEYEGLEVRAKSVPLGVFTNLTQIAGMDLAEATAPANVHRLGELFEGFAAALLSWNLKERHSDTGVVTEVPATLDGIYAQDTDFVLAMIAAWLDAIAGVSAPLATSSPGGKPSLEASLPMAPPSPSLAS